MLQRFIYILVFSLLISCGGENNQTESSSADSASDAATGTAEADSVAQAQAVEQATFTDLEGNPVSLSEFQGKVVLIDFWETWCKPCLASFKTIQQLVENYPDRFVVLAVTPGFTNTKEDARKFAANHEYDFVWLYDENKLHQKLNVQGIPYKVYVGPDGNFIQKSLGSKGPESDYKQAKKIIEQHS
ncbi:MAG: TlpA disulfide reductase family protein [Balneolaceae bacterium]|nr:TlpA disulfide reductase family protein [Balneolaceae bacterium]